MINIPNFLSGLRLVLVPVLFLLAWNGKPGLFLILLSCSLLSDFADGYIARKLDQVTELGAKLDSWGDFVTYLSVPVCAWWLWPEIIRREAFVVITLVVSLMVPILFGFLKFGKLSSYHTWGAKLSAMLMGVSGILLFAGGPAWPLRISTGILVIAQIEEIAITLVLPAWQFNVHSLWHARKSARTTTRGKIPPNSDPNAQG